MRIARLSLAIILAGSMAWAQDNSSPQQEPEQQKRPTLGKEAPETGGPSLEGPRTSTLTDARRLMRIRTVYVEHMDNQLSDRLTEGLAKIGRFRIVAERKAADAVFSGTCFDSRRLKRVHSEVFLNDRATGASIWQDIIRRPYNPPSLAKSIDDTAGLVMAHLTETLQEVERK